MALSVQNKNFLALLNKLDIDVKQFPDKTFDGLFDNVPEDINYFFNWLIENITPDNVLTQSEQATYFELESTKSLPLDEEMNYVLSSCNPDLNELMCLDVNYVNNFLPQDLEDQTSNIRELSQIYTDLEKNFTEIIKKENKLKEELSKRKKQVEVAKEECRNTDLLFVNEVENVKAVLLKEPNFSISLDSFNNLLDIEGHIFNKFKTCKLLENKICNSTDLDVLPALENDIGYVDISMILSEGFLRAKKAKLEFLTELSQKKSLQESFSSNNMIQSYLINNVGLDDKIVEEIKILENEVYEKIKILLRHEIKRISDQYLSQKSDLDKSYLTKLNTCKDYVTSNWRMNSTLLHVLSKCQSELENTTSIKKQLCLKLSEFERCFSNDVTSLELRKQRFREVSMQQNQHPLMLALKNIMSVEENSDSCPLAFENIYELMLQAKDDSSFISYKWRNDLQFSIKAFLDGNLRGPTSELLFAPADLIFKLQNCEERQKELALIVKRLASKFVNAKSLISNSDRKKLLSWIEVLINPQPVQISVRNSEEW